MFTWPVSDRRAHWVVIEIRGKPFMFRRLLEGFGQVLLGAVRQAQHSSLHKSVEFPLTMGRDFCGRIVAKGVNVRGNLNIGDTVMGVVPPFHQGCHAEFVTVPEGLVRRERFYFIARFLNADIILIYIYIKQVHFV